MFVALWVLTAAWAIGLVLFAFAIGRSVGYVAGLDHARNYYRAVAREHEGNA